MRVFVTGASGFIGSAVLDEIVAAGHDVVGLARSDASADAVAAAGAEVRRGTLDDPDGLAAAAADSDGVIHLAYNHDFAEFEAAARTDRQVIDAMGAALAGSDRPLVIASGLLGLPADRVATEDDRADPGGHPRTATAEATVALAERGVRTSVVRLSPTVHGEGDHGFVAYYAQLAREKGVAGYVGDGANHWPAVHRSDAAKLFRLALEQAPAGSVLHGAAEEGVPIRDVAEVVGRKLGVDAASFALEDAEEQFTWLGRFLALDVRASSARTRELLGWAPTGPTLMDDLEAGYYTGG